MKLSIVTTMFMSAPYVEKFYNEVKKHAAPAYDNDYEIIFVKDGSPDESFANSS